MRAAAIRAGCLAGAVCMGAIATAAETAAPQTVAIGAEDDAAPWSYADGSGYVNDLVSAAFREVGWTVQLKVIPYTRCKALVQAGTLAGCFSASKTPELQAALLYPKHPVFLAQNLLIARAESAWSGCDAAGWGARPLIGLVRGYEYVAAVDALAKDGRVKVDYAVSEVSNLRKIRAERIAAAVVTVDEVKRIDYVARLAHVPGDFKVVCDFGSLPAYVAFSRRHPQGAGALAAFEEGYERLGRRGAIAALQATWRARALDAAAVKQH
ncbi:MAG TPA: transporter substrate-binding domain-containing protein [Methylibium sp.]|nr:transporter substrate-binding domain-containing protein [Methylibium sp.]